MTEINTMQDIIDLAVQGFDDWQSLGHVMTRERGPLLLLNYTDKAVWENRWNYLERVSRGLIIDRERGEVAARPFDKFWNVGEGDREIDAPIRNVWEKADGSLGILYRENGEYRIATRGSFDSDQAEEATRMLQWYNIDGIHPGWTLLFEIIYPENRIVVDYGDERCLKLLAARDRFTGQYINADTLEACGRLMCCPVAARWPLGTLDDIVAWANQMKAAEGEGFVIETTAGTRWKVKSNDYRAVHRTLSLLSFKRVLELYPDRDWIENLPDHFRPVAMGYYNEIADTFNRVYQEVEGYKSAAPGGTRKDLALWIKETCPHLAPYMFATLDGKPLNQLIKKREFQNRKEPS